MDKSTITLLAATDDDTTDGISEKYTFDGKSNSVIVPEEKVNGVIPLKFTLTFSMKHTRGSKEEEAQKQAILCESDLTSTFFQFVSFRKN